MKTITTKKLFAFILMIIGMFSFAAANAQIVYNNVNPDLTSAGTYNLDLNNDGTTDFVITHTISTVNGSPLTCVGTKTNNFIKISPAGSNQIADSSNLVQKLAVNEIIDASLITWSGNANQPIATSTWICRPHHDGSYNWVSSNPGSWSNSVDGYMALKIIVSGNTYYGWLGMKTTLANSFTIRDYAFNSIPKQPILAGETSCTTPTVNLTQSGPLSFCAGDSVTLTANGTGYKYKWKKGGVNITGAKSQTYVAKTAGTYKCKVTNSCGSVTSTGKTVTVPCRLTNEVFTQLMNSYELKIAPNSLSNSSIISFTLEQSQKVSLKIFNVNGRLVTTLADKMFEEGENEIIWNAAETNTGIYFLRMETANYSENRKLIVAK